MRGKLWREALNDRGFKSGEETSIENRVREAQVREAQAWEGRDFSRAAVPVKYFCASALEVALFFSRSFAVAIACAALLSACAFAEVATYKAHCAPCHGAKGAADTTIAKNLNLRPLASAAVQNQSDEELFNVISKGAYRMPRYDRKLSKEQIHDLVKYIRSLKQ
jgi:cytochrome c553